MAGAYDVLQDPAWPDGYPASVAYVRRLFAGYRGDLALKADKAAPSAAGNLAALDASGNLSDSGVSPSAFAPSSDIQMAALSREVRELLGRAGSALQDHQDISGKADKSDTYTKSQTDGKIADAISAVKDSAPEAFDTLKEIADWIQDDQSGAAAMAAAIANKVDKVAGKGLSTNDYDNTEKGKVATALQPSDIDSTLSHAGKAADAKATGDAIAERYKKPNGGIPKTDMASAVQTSLGLADTAVQPAALRYALVDKTPPAGTVGNAVALDDRAVNKVSVTHRDESWSWSDGVDRAAPVFNENAAAAYEAWLVPDAYGAATNGFDTAAQDASSLTVYYTRRETGTVTAVDTDAGTATVSFPEATGLGTGEVSVNDYLEGVTHPVQGPDMQLSYGGEGMPSSSVSVGEEIPFFIEFSLEATRTAAGDSVSSLSFPQSVAGRSRDFVLSLSLGEGASAPSLSSSGVQYVPSAPGLANGSLVRFTEVASGVFLVTELPSASSAAMASAVAQLSSGFLSGLAAKVSKSDDYPLVDATPSAGTYGASVQLADRTVTRLAMSQASATVWTWSDGVERGVPEFDEGSEHWVVPEPSDGKEWEAPFNTSRDDTWLNFMCYEYLTTPESWEVTAYQPADPAYYVPAAYTITSPDGSMTASFEVQNGYAYEDQMYVTGSQSVTGLVLDSNTPVTATLGEYVHVVAYFYNVTATKSSVSGPNVGSLVLPPAPEPRVARDFLLRVEMPANLTPFAWPAGATFETEDGELPDLSAAGTYLVSFTETKPDVFLVASKSVEAYEEEEVSS